MPQPDLKVGDRVRCIDRYPSDAVQIGDTGIVVELRWPHGVLVAWDHFHDGHADSDQHGAHRKDLWWMRESELELAP